MPHRAEIRASLVVLAALVPLVALDLCAPHSICAQTAPVQAAPAPLPAAAPAPSEALKSAESLQDAFVEVAARVSKSVVAIRVESRRRLRNPFEGSPLGEWFRDALPRERYEVQHGTGSGVVVRADGHILTNRHVIANARRVEVVFQDGRKLLGKTIGVDDATDLAVVKVDAHDLVAAPLADSSTARPGQWVIAIGSPFGLDYTVTVGVVSAVGRRGVGMNEIEDYLQTDASINPGNSGGPLINLHGEVLGINEMIVGGGTGIGFAIPSSLARDVSDQLIASGTVRRAYLGVALQDLTPELAKQFGADVSGGALVGQVAKDGPADRAGLVAGDVIVSVDGKPVVESRALLRLVLLQKIGVKLSIGVLRDKHTRTLTLTTAERPARKHAVDDNADGDTLD